MKVALASRYRIWMCVLFPMTAGLGTIALWLLSLKWPLRIDERGVTFRCHRRVDWRSITKIGLSRSYLDGHCSQIRLHHDGGTSKIPVDALQDGQAVVQFMLAMFDVAHRRAFGSSVGADPPVREPSSGRGQHSMWARAQLPLQPESEQRTTHTLSHEFEMLRDALQRRSEFRNSTILEKEHA
jgi:hypothetical protein